MLLAAFKFFSQFDHITEENWYIRKPNLNPSGYGYLQTETVSFAFQSQDSNCFLDKREIICYISLSVGGVPSTTPVPYLNGGGGGLPDSSWLVS